MRDAWFRFQHKNAPYIFVAPFLILFTLFGLYPLVQSAILAFYVTNGPKARIFVGLGNFKFMFNDPLFWIALKNTLVFTLASLCIQLPMSLGLAMLLNQGWLKGRTIFRFCFFSPYLIGTVFVGILAPLLFAPKYGLVNRSLFELFGRAIEKPWLTDVNNVMPAIVLTSLWIYVGFNMIYFLAALQTVDKDLYEAARVDGANAVQRFWHVTLPGIRPVAIFVIVLSTIGSFQFFELPWIMLAQSANPNNAGLFLVTYLYQEGFVAGDLGFASSVGWTLALGVTGLAVLQMWLGGTWKRAE